MSGPPPLVSIVVPTYRRPIRLAVCLEALSRLDYPPDRFEVLVVDDGSGEPPHAVVAPLRHRLDVTLLTPPHAGPAAARNTGAARAKGEILAFTDDDCAPVPTWLSVLTERLTATPGCAVGGRTLNALPGRLCSTASQLLIDYLYATLNADPRQARFLTSNNLAVPANRFRDIGGFDPDFPLPAGEDREFCARWRHHGYQLLYAPEALVRHAHPLTFHTFWRQQFNYGRGAFRFHTVRPRSTRQPTGLGPATFYLKLPLYPLTHAPRWRTPALVALLTVSQLATASGFLRERVASARARSPAH